MSLQIKIGQLIPDATYRIRSVLKPDHYLDHQSSSGQDDVRPLASDPAADTQKVRYRYIFVFPAVGSVL